MAEIKIGWGRENVTPTGPCMVAGQMSNRLALQILDQLYTTALALEADQTKVIMISLDAVAFRQKLMEAIREKFATVTGLKDVQIFGSVTHTHTAPQYGTVIPKEEWIMSEKFSCECPGNRGVDVEEIRKKHPDFVDSEQYFDYLVEKITAAAVSAWNARANGKIAYGMGTAVVGECRRLVMKDKGGIMYALEDDPEMLHAEGHVDHALNVLATYSMTGELTGLVLNVACPSQVSEALKIVSADYWNEVRAEVGARWGKDIYILPQCGAAGDQSPHKILTRKADERMMMLRGQQKDHVAGWKWGERVYDLEYGLARRREIARRIAVALEDVLPVIAPTAESEPVFKASAQVIDLPARKITGEEAANAQKDADFLIERMKQTGSEFYGSINWNLGVVKRYKNPLDTVPMELNVVRIGDVAFSTNSYELYLDYGDRIKGRSNAVQTFLMQLANGMGSYLPTKRSGTTGYGSVPASCIVTYDGGDKLVEESVKAINALFE